MEWILNIFKSGKIEKTQWSEIMLEWDILYSFQLLFRHEHNMSKQAFLKYLNMPSNRIVLISTFPSDYVEKNYKAKSFKTFQNVLVKLRQLRNNIPNNFQNIYETDDSRISWFMEKNFDEMKKMGIDLIFLTNKDNRKDVKNINCLRAYVHTNTITYSESGYGFDNSYGVIENESEIKYFITKGCKFLDWSKIELDLCATTYLGTT